MPRPAQSEEQREQVRQRIIVAAQSIFDSAGIDGVSMRAVGARVGLTASALYAYFPSKIELVRALWSDALDELDHTVQTLSLQEADPIEAVKAAGRAYARFAMENPVRFRFLFGGGRLAAELSENEHSKRVTYAIVLGRFTEAITQGRVRLTDPELATQTLWAGIHGVITLLNSWSDFPFRPPSLMISTMVDTLILGMLASPVEE